MILISEAIPTPLVATVVLVVIAICNSGIRVQVSGSNNVLVVNVEAVM